MKKILFLALHLGFGGVERAIISQANMLADKYEVEIASAYKLYEKPAFPLDERVKVTYLSETLKPNKEELKAAISSKNPIAIIREVILSVRVLHHRTAKMKQMVQQTDADIIISTRHLYNALLAKYRKNGVITIAQEHNHHNEDEKYIQQIVDSVQGIDYLMPVSKELTAFYAERVGKTICKYIPHSLESIPSETSKLTEPMLVSVGRLSPEKGYLDLVEVYASIQREHPDWKLHIVGDGEERPAIEKKIDELGLGSHVVMHGYQKKDYINTLLEMASIYMMCSHTESFGIVLIEAQAYGIPCVAFSSAKGALEIIEHDENGYLIPNRDFEEMKTRVCTLIEDDKLRQKMGKRSRENALQYAKETVQQQWFAFLEEICN